MPRPLLLVMTKLPPAQGEALAAQFDVIHLPADGLATDRLQGLAALLPPGREVSAILTSGRVGLTAGEIDMLPKLEIVCLLAAGHDRVALAHATARGIRVCTSGDANSRCVADHAMALLLAAARRIRSLDAWVRQGGYSEGIAYPMLVAGKRIGIAGLGTIGRLIAQRAAAFDLEVGYCGRRRQDGVPHPYFASIRELAQWADFLVVATPGGPETLHLVDAGVLDALGPDGVLVNISRGSTVDTAALARALQEGRIGAAGLDVYEGEPAPPAALLPLENVVLTPHMAAFSPQMTALAVQRAIDNLGRHFGGEALLSAVN